MKAKERLIEKYGLTCPGHRGWRLKEIRAARMSLADIHFHENGGGYDRLLRIGSIYHGYLTSGNRQTRLNNMYDRMYDTLVPGTELVCKECHKSQKEEGVSKPTRGLMERVTRAEHEHLAGKEGHVSTNPCPACLEIVNGGRDEPAAQG